MTTKEKITPQQFAKEHWKGVLFASSTLAGAAVLLLIRYFRQKHAEEAVNQAPGQHNQDMNPLTARELTVLELEASTGQDSTIVNLEIGIAAKKTVPNATEILGLLAEGVTETDGKEALKILQQVK